MQPDPSTTLANEVLDPKTDEWRDKDAYSVKPIKAEMTNIAREILARKVRKLGSNDERPMMYFFVKSMIKQAMGGDSKLGMYIWDRMDGKMKESITAEVTKRIVGILPDDMTDVEEEGEELGET